MRQILLDRIQQSEAPSSTRIMMPAAVRTWSWRRCGRSYRCAWNLRFEIPVADGFKAGNVAMPRNDGDETSRPARFNVGLHPGGNSSQKGRVHTGRGSIGLVRRKHVGAIGRQSARQERACDGCGFQKTMTVSHVHSSDQAQRLRAGAVLEAIKRLGFRRPGFRRGRLQSQFQDERVRPESALMNSSIVRAHESGIRHPS